MDTDTCVGYITRGKRRGLRCQNRGLYEIGVNKYKVCEDHSSSILRFARQGYGYPVWMEDLLSRALKGRYDHA